MDWDWGVSLGTDGSVRHKFLSNVHTSKDERSKVRNEPREHG
jgi:hypothetical protein